MLDSKVALSAAAAAAAVGIAVAVLRFTKTSKNNQHRTPKAQLNRKYSMESDPRQQEAQMPQQLV
jgi:mannose/fructose/N-acetylgalactosamine-specific phosphotransferase system component IIC